MKLDSEDTLVVTNVLDKLNYVMEHVIEALDFNITKETTNASAGADVVINGTEFKNVNVNAILTAETRIKN